MCISSDHLMAFIASEAGERASAMKPTDGDMTRAEDVGFLEGLEVVAAYVLRVTHEEAA